MKGGRTVFLVSTKCQSPGDSGEVCRRRNTVACFASRSAARAFIAEQMSIPASLEEIEYFADDEASDSPDSTSSAPSL